MSVMKRGPVIILCYLILLLSAFLPVQKTVAPSSAMALARLVPPPAPKQTPELRPEVRALWVVRHTLVSPQAVIELVRRAKENNFTDLVVQVRGRGDAYYVSRLEPRAEDLSDQPAGFDPLSLVIDEAHRVGIRVHAWINIFIVAGVETLPKTKDHILYRHPDWVMVPRELAAELYHVDPKSPDYLRRIVDYTRANRTELEGLYVSPAHPEVKENILKIWLDVAEKYHVDGLHFDYVRYPNPNFDFSRSSLERFREEIDRGLDAENRDLLAMQHEGDPLIYASTFPEKYAQFQRDQVTGLVERIYKSVKKIKPYAQISAAVMANDEGAARTRFQDWKLWLQRGWLDIVCPMAYTPDTETFRQLMVDAVGKSAGRQVWGGIGAYRQPAESTLEKIRVAREAGVNGFILFSYDSSIKVSETNPGGDYLERMREALKIGSRAAPR